MTNLIILYVSVLIFVSIRHFRLSFLARKYATYKLVLPMPLSTRCFLHGFTFLSFICWPLLLIPKPSVFFKAFFYNDRLAYNLIHMRIGIVAGLMMGLLRRLSR